MEGRCGVAHAAHAAHVARVATVTTCQEQLRPKARMVKGGTTRVSPCLTLLAIQKIRCDTLIYDSASRLDHVNRFQLSWVESSCLQTVEFKGGLAVLMMMMPARPPEQTACRLCKRWQPGRAWAEYGER